MTVKLTMRIVSTVALMCISFAFCAQQRFSREERLWALGHPVAALRIRQISKRCDVLYSHSRVKQELDSFSSGGKLDAFRHVFYMAAFAQKIRLSAVRKLGEAHEKGNYRQFLAATTEEGELPDSLSSVMDLKNNELGLAIGCNFSKLTLLELERTVLYAISQGKAVIMRRDKGGNYLRCDGSEISPLVFRGKWAVPKCLVPSNQAPD
jgi:hypothetical protein